ncbi:MAG: Hsp20 family protein [Acidobacteria bacterium]|nr:Hsp20 family protein [Acidobacteriota bacterium]
MHAQPALEKKSATKPLFVEAEKIFDQMKEFSQSIAQRAYELFDTRGRELGHELEDWFRAEFELMRWVPIALKEADGKLVVRAEVPGFNASDIKISVEPNQLTISGQKVVKPEERKEEQDEKRFFSEFRANQFCRTLTLPATVDTTAKTEAALKDGVLELTLTKAPASEPVSVLVKTG